MKYDSQASFEREMRRITLQTAECRLEAAKAECERERLMLEATGDALVQDLGAKRVQLLRTRVRWLMKQEAVTEDEKRSAKIERVDKLLREAFITKTTRDKIAKEIEEGKI